MDNGPAIDRGVSEASPNKIFVFVSSSPVRGERSCLGEISEISERWPNTNTEITQIKIGVISVLFFLKAADRV